MTYLHTCVGCSFTGNCVRQATLRQSLKGTGVVSAKHRCPVREPLYKPGQAVIFTTYDTEGENAVEVQFPGYVVECKGGKVVGFIKDGTLDIKHGYSFEPRGNGYVKIPSRRVKADTSRVSANANRCDLCGNHPGLGAACQKDPQHTPAAQCLFDATASGP